MKTFFLFIFTFFMLCIGAFAQEAQPVQSGGIQEELRSIRQKMDELIRSEAELRDRQTTRIMRMEEDMETLRQSLGRQISEKEQALSRDNALLREYIDIMNNNISKLEENTATLEAGLQNLESRTRDADESMAEIRSDMGGVAQDLAAVDKAVTALEKSFQEITASVEDAEKILVEFDGLESRLSEISGDIFRTGSELDELSSRMDQESEKLVKDFQHLEKRVSDEMSTLAHKISYSDQGVGERINAAQNRIDDLSGYIEEREVYAAGLLAGVGFLTLVSFLMTFFLRKKTARVEQRHEQINAQLRQKIEDQSAVLDTRLVELLEKQIPLLAETEDASEHDPSQGTAAPADHSLAIVLGEEIYRIMKRNKELSGKSEYYEELRSSLRRLWTAFREKGYELVDLQGKTYHEDMEANPEFVLTHELLPGEQVVSRMTRPLIRHKGIMVQKAEIEVMVGE